MKRILFVLSALVLISGVDPVLAASVVSPVSAVIDSGGQGGPAFGIEKTIDHSGLLIDFTSGITDFDTYFAGTPQHDAVHVPGSGHEWFSSDGAHSAIVTYDFGSLMTIDRLALWNEERAGIASFDVLGSHDGSAFTSIATGLTPTNNPVSGLYPADIFSLGSINARFVRLNLNSCPQSGNTYDGCSIGEVAFSATPALAPVPVPAALPLLGSALAALGLWRRKIAS